MKRFATPSKSTIVRDEFRKLPVGAEFEANYFAQICGISQQNASSAIWYLREKGAVKIINRSHRPFRFVKICNDDIKDQGTHSKSEKVIIRRKSNVIRMSPPVGFQSTEAADLKASNDLLRAQLKSKMEDILTTLAEVDEILDNMK